MMKKLSFSFLTFIVFSFILIFSCSTEEEDTIAPAVQSPQSEQRVKQYILTVTSAEGGTVSTEGGTYDEGTEVTITATPSEGYRFTGWEGNSSTSESLTITLNSNQTYQALFELIPIDTDGDGIVDSEDAWPLDSSMTENLWGAINDGEVEFFFASDVPESISQGTRDSFLEAIEEFGNWGPTELWVTGTGIEETEELVNLFCSRRVERGQSNFSSESHPFSFESCKQYQLFPQNGSDLIDPSFSYMLNDEEGSGFEYYRRKSLESVENNYATGWGKSLNGVRYWGIKIFNFSLPVGFSEPGYNYDYEKVNIFYEYFHALQESALIDENYGNTDEFGEDTRRGPHWFYAGASTYMAEYAVRKRNPQHNLNTLKERIEQQFGYAMCDDVLLSELTPESNCFLMRFYWGMPAVAYLLEKVDNQNAIVESFYPNLYEKGFKDAFELTFGITVEEFYEEWEVFINLPMEERLEIIPNI